MRVACRFCLTINILCVSLCRADAAPGGFASGAANNGWDGPYLGSTGSGLDAWWNSNGQCFAHYSVSRVSRITRYRIVLLGARNIHRD